MGDLTETTPTVNEALLDVINHQAGRFPAVDATARFLANDAIFVLGALLLVLGVLELRRNRARAIRIASAAGLALVITGGLILLAGQFVSEQRPFIEDVDTVLLVKHAADNSFPSDHAAVSAAAATAGILAWPRWRISLAVLVALIGVARIFVGVHYPGDIAAGWLGGVAAAAVAWAATSWALQHLWFSRWRASTG